MVAHGMRKLSQEACQDNDRAVREKLHGDSGHPTIFRTLPPTHVHPHIGLTNSTSAKQAGAVGENSVASTKGALKNSLYSGQ